MQVSIEAKDHKDGDRAIRFTGFSNDVAKAAVSGSKDFNIRTEGGRLSGDAMDFTGARDGNEAPDIIKAKTQPQTTGERPPEGALQPNPFRGDGCKLQESPFNPKLTPREAGGQAAIGRDEHQKKEEFVLVESSTVNGTSGGKPK